MNKSLQEEPTKENRLKVSLWLRVVENSNKYIRGKTKVRLDIEQSVLRQYGMEKLHKDSCEYTLSIPYNTDEELDKTITDLLQEADFLVDLRNCFTEADVRALDSSERSW